MSLEELTEASALGMSGPVLRRRFGDRAAAGILKRNEVVGVGAGTGEDRQAVHGKFRLPGGAGYRSLAGDLLSIGIGWAVLPVNLLPPGLRDQVKDVGARMLRGLAGLNRDVAEALDRAADRLRWQSGQARRDECFSQPPGGTSVRIQMQP